MLGTVMDAMVETAVMGLGAAVAMALVNLVIGAVVTVAMVGAGADHVHWHPPTDLSPCSRRGCRLPARQWRPLARVPCRWEKVPPH